MHAEQRRLTHALLREKGIDCALFANRENVGWLTGFVPSLLTGPNIFAGAPPLVWYEDGRFTLIVIDGLGEAAAAFAKEPDGEVLTYLGYTIQQPIDGLAQLMKVLTPRLGAGRNATRIGVELVDVNAATFVALKTAANNGNFPSIDGWLKPLRMVKTAEEITQLRENFRLTDLTHAVARRVTKVGMREIDVWEEMHMALMKETGERIALGNDCVVSYRQNNIGGWPSDLVLRAGDSLMVDMSVIKNGYWSDSCATYYASEPNQKQIAMHKMAEQALALGKSLVKPGAIAKQIDKTLRDFVVKSGYAVYPHHTGHAVGLSGHEAPRIVPYNEEVLQAGMVIMLEPGTYFPGEAAVRHEDAFLVTTTGCEQLTKHDKSLP